MTLSSSAPSDPVDLSVIIVSWNVWDLLRACLHSLEAASQPHSAAYTRKFGPAVDFSPDAPKPDTNGPATMEVVVVDNASSDATVDLLPAAFPWVRLVCNADNLGFTGGNNVGYAAARGRFVLFLNPDTEVVATPRHGNCLWALYEAVASDASVVLAGPQLRYADNSLQSSRRRFPGRLTGFLESSWLGRLWPGNPWAQRLHYADWPGDHRQEVDWVVGAAMLARRDALEAIRMPIYPGPFDEGFFMYSEELDLCHRLKDAGGRVIYVPEARVIHYEGRSSEQVAVSRHIHFNRSKIRYYAKYFGPTWAEALRRFLLLEFRWQILLERAKWLFGHKRLLRAERIAAYREVLATGLRGESQ